jgi:hypothetical protein
LTKKFPAIKALPRRNAAWILSVFLGLPMLVLAVMGALPGRTPLAVWIVVGVLASAVAACLWVIGHPRWYLEVDTFREAATWVGPDGDQPIPLHEVGPLYIGRVITVMPPRSPRPDPVVYRVLTAAAPVVLAEASTREAAERKMRRLAARLGLEVANVPEKTEYLKPGEGGY